MLGLQKNWNLILMNLFIQGPDVKILDSKRSNEIGLISTMEPRRDKTEFFAVAST